MTQKKIQMPEEYPRIPTLIDQLRKLAAHAAYAVSGEWPQYDLYPDHIDDLCDKLKVLGNELSAAKPNPNEDNA